jgi:chemotaxis protein MotA
VSRQPGATDFKLQLTRVIARLDLGMVAGILIAVTALVAGIAVTGISAHYFFQATGLLVVVGGTFGVTLITTPPLALFRALQRTLRLFFAEAVPNPEALIDEIVGYAKVARIKGLVAIELQIDQVSHGFLREALLLAMDTRERMELQSDLENKIRHCERQSEAAARVLEVAGGFAPTIGVMGTVVGLIDVLRQFSNLAMVASGVGAAFTSTIYGLALANLVLLPAAQRIRARAAETFDVQELMMEGAMCLFDGIHSMQVRQRLLSFLKAVPTRERSLRALESAMDAGQP